MNKRNIFKIIWYSIFRSPPFPKSERERDRFRRNNLVLHFRPRTVPEETLRFTLSWGLGGTAVVLILLSIGTGLLLKFVYQPFPDRAYDSVVILQNEVLFGRFMRNIHHWSGNFLIVIAFLHMLRIFFTGAFHPPRQFNWVIGFSILLIIVVSNFTGYLLPWDQLAFWAVTICTGVLEYIPMIGGWLQRIVRGGTEIGPATLSNFFAIHTAIVPVCLVILMPFHFWRVRKAGGLVVANNSADAKSKGEFVAAIPHLILRELAVASVAVAFIFVFALLFDAPLEGKANPGLSPNPTKAPWFFVGIQEMLLHFHPLFGAFIIPLIIFCALALLPYFNYDKNTSGIWFASKNGRRIAAGAALAATIITPLGIVADEFFFSASSLMPALPDAISGGLIPATLIFAGIFGCYLLIKKKYSKTNNEAIQAIFVLLVVAFLVFTVTGIWFRGSGMDLVWPWGAIE